MKKYHRENAAHGYPALPEKLFDFRLFLIYVWRALGMPDPTPLQLDIAAWLQSGPRRKIIEAFRGAGKSWITSAYVMWRLRLAPDTKFLVVSAGKERADNFTTFCMRLMQDVDVLKCLSGARALRNSKASFDVSGAAIDHSPSVKSVGITGQLTGTRADEIIADDIETHMNSLTESERGKLAECVKEFDAIIKPNGSITYLGTPQTEQSLYDLLQKRGYTVRVWPARYPTEEQVTAYSTKLAPFIDAAINKRPELAGTPSDILRFSHDDLLERELSYGRQGFALQFMLDTSLSDALRYPLKLSDLIVADLAMDSAHEIYEWDACCDTLLHSLHAPGLNGDAFHSPKRMSGTKVPYKQRIIAIDPSGRGKDETAYVILYERDGYIFLMESGGIEGGYDISTLEKLAAAAKLHDVGTVLIESNFGDGMFKELLIPVLSRTAVQAEVIEVRQHKQKESRIIDTLEPVMSGHRLIVNMNAILRDAESVARYPSDIRHCYMLFYQMPHIVRQSGALAHDDRLDALAMGAAHFTECMRQDAETKAQRRLERFGEMELKAFTETSAPRRNKETLMYLGYTPRAIAGAAHMQNDTHKDIRNKKRR